MMRRLIALLLTLICLCSTTAQADGITLGKGTWVIGVDIPAGYYKITEKKMGYMVTCDVIDAFRNANLDASSVYRWLDSKPECILKEGMYLCIGMGQYTFTPITLTAAQQANTTYKGLLEARKEALWNNFEDKEQHVYDVDVGTYKVGVDIPAGNWCIRYFDTFPKTVTVTHNFVRTRLRIYSPSMKGYTPDMLTHTYLKLADGDTVKIEADKGNVGLFFIPLSNDYLE